MPMLTENVPIFFFFFFWGGGGGSAINPNRHLRYVKGVRRMGAANFDRRSEKDLA